MATSNGYTQRSIDIQHDFDGGSEEAFKALIAAFGDRSRVTVQTHTSDSHSLTVKSRILQHQAPDIWSCWPGQNLAPYIDTGVVADLSDLWERSGLEEKYLAGPRRAVRFDGKYSALPLNIHRTNNLFVDRESCEQAGASLRSVSTPEALPEVLDQLADHVENPLAFPQRNPWPMFQFWECVLLGQFGLDVYQDLISGQSERHRSEIRRTLEIVAECSQFTAEESLYVSNMAGIRKLPEGNAALINQGDWAFSEYQQRNTYGYEEEWDHLPFPGTENTYITVMDAFTVSKDSYGTEAIDEFLSFLASAKAIRTFNSVKGSIPPRNDVDVSSLDPFLLDQMKDFESAEHVPSMVHGLAVRPALVVELKSAFATFISRMDVQQTTGEIVEILTDAEAST